MQRLNIKRHALLSMQKGDMSSLHIIIFDEIDSICQRRGMDNSGTVNLPVI